MEAIQDTVGSRIREVRTQRRMSLHDVEVLSGGALKASVLGAYERAERGISVRRAQQIADLFEVPLDRIIPVSLDHGQRVLRDLSEQILAAVLHALPCPCVVTADGRIVVLYDAARTPGLDRLTGDSLQEEARRIADFLEKNGGSDAQ